MSEEEYRHVYNFITNHSYPISFSKNQENSEKKVLLSQEWASLIVHGKSEAKEDQKWRQVARSVKDNKLCSPVILQLKVKKCCLYATRIKMQI